MTHYECCYSSGRQHVFAESRHWLVAGVLAVAFIGLVVGLSIGITVSIVGLIIFEALMVAMACWSSYLAYKSMFRCVSSSVDISGYIIGNLTFSAVFCCLVGLVRYSWQSGLGPITTTALLSVGGVLLGVLSYGYACLLLQEDERKHHLSVESSSGGSMELGLRPPGLQELRRFLVWIATWQWFRDASVFPTPDEEESMHAGEEITVYNDTLKLIKVCLYAHEDLMCWVPYGGISGRCVCLIHAESSRTINLLGGGAQGRIFQMKVFQPGVFDKELACYARAQCGQVLTFSDVEGMVRRSRSLSATPALPLPRRSAALADDSEDDCSPHGLAAQGLHAAPRCGGAGGGGGGLLRRCGSSGLLTPRAPTEEAALAAEGADGGGIPRCKEPQGGAKSLHAEARKAAADEIVVRNRSNQDISMLLFNANDYCFLVPLCGGVRIPPREEHRFSPQKSAACEFTLKAYSVGPGAKELTYLTVGRGSTYMFCDSLLS